jgi:hypothetical protein
LLQQGWKDVGKVFLIATILDVVYELIVHGASLPNQSHPESGIRRQTFL